MSDKTQVFTVKVTPRHEGHTAMSPAFMEHLLQQAPYDFEVSGGKPCNCHEEKK